MRAGFGAGCFLAATTAGEAEVAGCGAGAVAPAAGGPDERAAAAAPVAGSGVMMLTAGVDAEVGNSALVGLPVGSDAPSAAIGPVRGLATPTGAFHIGA